MRTYRDLFHSPEFTPLFLSSAAQIAAMTVSGLGLATLVFTATGSPLLSALAIFGPSLAQVLGATMLLSAADRLPPRAALTALAVLFGLGTAAQAIPGIPIPVIFALLLVLGVAATLAGAVRYGLLNEILPKQGYVLGRSVLNMAAGLMQIGGFALGAVLLGALSPRGTLLVGTGLYLVSAAVIRFGLKPRPQRATGRPSAGETWRNNRRLFSAKPRRYVYLALWLPNGLVVGCESLFVPYSPRHAGMLFAFGAFGMLVGDTVAGRFTTQRWRQRLGGPLRLLLAVPYLVFAIRPALPLAVAAVVLASVGYAATLLLQERLLELTPDELSGHALGLHASGMMTMQGVGAALAGAVAQQTSPETGMAVMSALSLLITLLLAPGLRTHPGLADPPRASQAPHLRGLLATPASVVEVRPHPGVNTAPGACTARFHSAKAECGRLSPLDDATLFCWDMPENTLAVRAMAMIAASPERVWEVLTDLSGYRHWHPILELVDGPLGADLTPGTVLRLRARGGTPDQQDFQVRVIEAARPRTLVWEGGDPRTLLGRHRFALTEQGEGTQLLDEEVFAGSLAAAMVAERRTALEADFLASVSALKEAVERRD